MDKFESKEYKLARKANVAHCTFEYFITLMIGDAFLATLLSSMGIADSVTGIIASLVSFSFLFQLLSIAIVKRMRNTKKTAIILHTVGMLFFTSVYLVPFLPIESVRVKTILVGAGIILGYIFYYSVQKIIFKWANGFVSPTKRGEYSATKEMISLITGIVFTIIIGYVMDHFEMLNNIKGSFIFTAASMLILTVCHFISLMLIKNEEHEKGENIPFGEVIKNTLGNKNFRNVIIMHTIFSISTHFTTGFLGTFKTKDLLISVGTVQIINMIGNLTRFAISKPFGRYSDKHTFIGGIKLAYLICASAFLINVFTTPATWWLMIGYTTLYAVSVAGTNQNSFNIIYSYVDQKYFVQASAIKSSISGILGFGSSLVGSRILAFVQANGNSLFGLPVYGQQLLSLISFAGIICAFLFAHFVVGKQKVMIQ